MRNSIRKKRIKLRNYKNYIIPIFLSIFIIGIMNVSAVTNFISNQGIISKEINATNWGNVTINESQISDLAHTIDTSSTVNCTGDETLLANGTCQNTTLFYSASSESDPVWNANYSIFTGLIDNASYLDTHNATYDNYATNVSRNWSANTFSIWDSRWLDGNSSWTQSVATSLYAPISVIDTSASVNCSDGEVFLGNGTCWATSVFFDNVDTNVLTDSDFNATQMENSGGALNILESWITTFVSSLGYLDSYTNVALTNQTNTFTLNQNMSNNNITSVDCIFFNSGGRICSN